MRLATLIYKQITVVQEKAVMFVLDRYQRHNYKYFGCKMIIRIARDHLIIVCTGGDLQYATTIKQLQKTFRHFRPLK